MVATHNHTFRCLSFQQCRFFRRCRLRGKERFSITNLNRYRFQSVTLICRRDRNSVDRIQSAIERCAHNPLPISSAIFRPPFVRSLGKLIEHTVIYRSGNDYHHHRSIVYVSVASAFHSFIRLLKRPPNFLMNFQNLFCHLVLRPRHPGPN